VTIPEIQAAYKKDTSNMLPHDTAMLLRKKKHTWPRADAKVKEVMQVLKTKRDSSTIAPDYEKLPPREWKKQVDFRGKLILAPLTTVGNLPFRRICKSFGADITIGEMALCSNLLQGKASEWALTRRHECEDVFGIQIAGNFADMTARTVELLNHYTDADFIDLNSGCPIDMLYNNGMGCGLMNRPQRMAEAVCAMTTTSTVPITLKIRAGRDWSAPVAHSYVDPKINPSSPCFAVYSCSLVAFFFFFFYYLLLLLLFAQ
jgi:tRNA-dihydrouridine synthase 3